MEPIPETVQAINNLDPDPDPATEVDLLAELVQLADRAQEAVPDLVGVSIARLDDGLTFTLVASTEEVALLDGIQYVAGGPCVDGAHSDQVLEFDNDDALDEERWRLFAQATAAHAVRSTLTLPLNGHGRVVGTVNLYAASWRAFVGSHNRLAAIFGAWAAGAVANADLSFTTRLEAQAAPGRVQEQFDISVATGLMAERLGIDVDAAETSMRDAASRAGVALPQLAHEIVTAHKKQDLDDEDDRI
jgi:GAF domain-containing protein